MLNPVQGVKTFEAKHPKAAKAAKIGAAVAATAAVVAGVGYAVYKGKGLDEVYKNELGKSPSFITKIAAGYTVIGGKIAKVASDVASKTKEVASTVAGKAKEGASKIASKFKKETVVDEATRNIIDNTPLADTSARAAAHFAEANLYA